MAKTGMRSSRANSRVTWLSCGRPPSASTFTAKVCHAVYAGHHPSSARRAFGQRLSRKASALGLDRGVDRVAEAAAALQDVQHVAREVGRHAISQLALPEREPAVRALERRQLGERGGRRLLRVGGVDVGKAEGAAEVGGQRQGQGGRRPLLRAAVRILDEVARAFAQADQRGGRGLEMQPAEPGHDARPGARASPAPASRSARRRRRPPARRGSRPGSPPRRRRSRRRSFAVIWMRARPTVFARTSNRTSAAPLRRAPAPCGARRPSTSRTDGIEAAHGDDGGALVLAAGCAPRSRSARCRPRRGSAGRPASAARACWCGSRAPPSRSARRGRRPRP